MHPDHLPGTWHVVLAGETSGVIAEKAGIPLEDFLEINGLKRGEVLVPGRTLFILGKPEVQPTVSEAAPAPVGSASPVPTPGTPGKSNAPLRWPDGTISSKPCALPSTECASVDRPRAS